MEGKTGRTSMDVGFCIKKKCEIGQEESYIIQHADDSRYSLLSVFS